MSYGHGLAVRYVPECRTYAKAKSIFDNTKPIRGRADNKKPLARRKDVDSFWMRENSVDGVATVEFMAYHTPVVTFYEDGRIRVFTDGWTTPSTHNFIKNVLSVLVKGYQGKTVITFRGAQHLLTTNEFWFKSLGDGAIEAHENQVMPTLYEYKMNRKATNQVRKMYKPFIDYLKNVAALRQEPFVWYGIEEMVIHFEAIEVVNGVGVDEHGSCHAVEYRYITERPNEQSRWGRNVEMYNTKGAEFMAMAASGDHEQYYKAFLILLGMNRVLTVKHEFTFHQNVKGLFKRFDDIMLRWHAEEVLSKEEVGTGCLPKPNYAKWL